MRERKAMSATIGGITYDRAQLFRFKDGALIWDSMGEESTMNETTKDGPDLTPFRLGTVVVDWLLHFYGFEPFEIERRRFLDRHHHLINPRFYTPQACANLDQLVARHAMAAEFMRLARLDMIELARWNPAESMRRFVKLLPELAGG